METEQYTLNDQWVIEIREKINKITNLKENQNTTYHNLRDTAKLVLRRNFGAMSANIKLQRSC